MRRRRVAMGGRSRRCCLARAREAREAATASISASPGCRRARAMRRPGTCSMFASPEIRDVAAQRHAPVAQRRRAAAEELADLTLELAAPGADVGSLPSQRLVQCFLNPSRVAFGDISLGSVLYPNPLGFVGEGQSPVGPPCGPSLRIRRALTQGPGPHARRSAGETWASSGAATSAAGTRSAGDRSAVAATGPASRRAPASRRRPRRSRTDRPSRSARRARDPRRDDANSRGRTRWYCGRRAGWSARARGTGRR
jgi:hypothetical protein